jgi:membrane associated rhomboid family serine protease
VKTIVERIGRHLVGIDYTRYPLYSIGRSGNLDFIGIVGFWFPVQFVDFGLLSWNNVEILLVAYFSVFVAWILLPRSFMVDNFMVSRNNVTNGRVLTLLTCSVSHHDIFHLLKNSFTLLSIGYEVMARMDNFDFWLLYSVCGVAGSAASLAFNSKNSASLGGSGALYGLFGYLAHSTNGYQRVFWFGFDLSIGEALLSSLGLSLVTSPHTAEDVAGHLGGAAAGAFLFPVLAESLRRV